MSVHFHKKMFRNHTRYVPTNEEFEDIYVLIFVSTIDNTLTRSMHFQIIVNL